MWSWRVGREGVGKALLGAIVLVVWAAGAGRADAGNITVMWDLMEAPNVTGYRVFVGTSSQKYTESFDVPASRNFYIYRTAFNARRYFFAVAAQFDGKTFGPRSSEVTAVGTRTVPGDLAPGRVNEPVAGADCQDACFVVTRVATGLGDVSSLVASPDGGLFAVENGRRVISIEAGSARSMWVADSGASVHAIALDPQFTANGRVFVTQRRPRDRSTSELEILRLQYLAGSLGQPATIVAGLLMPAALGAPFAIDGDGLMYVAMPMTSERDPYSGTLLVFDSEGRTPDGHRSPVVGRALDQPTGLVWDSQSRMVWLTGNAAQVLAVAPDGQRVEFASGAGADESLAAIGSGRGSRRLIVAAGTDLVESEPGADGLRIGLDAYGTPVAIATGPAGERYVAVKDADASSYSVLKIEGAAARRVP